MIGSKFLTSGNVSSSFVLMAALLTVMVFIYRFLDKKYKRLNEPSMIEKCGNLYPNMPLNRNKPYIYRFPAFMLHRFLFVLIAKTLFNHITFTIQLIVMMNLFYTMYRVAHLPSAEKSQVRIGIFTDVGVHFMML